MEKLKILYLTHDGLTDPLGQSQILPYLKGLADENSITIISFEKQDRYTQNRNSIETICEDYKLNWIPLVYHRSPPLLSTIYDVFSLYRKALSLHKAESFDVVHCRSYVTALIGLRLKNKHGLKFIFDMRGFWADERKEGRIWNLNNPLYRLIYNYFKKKEREFLKQADHIVVLTDTAKKVIQEWEVTSSPVTVIPCCVDMDLFNPGSVSHQEQIEIRQSLGIDIKDFVLLYLGSWGTWYLTDEMIAFFEATKKKIPAARFLILTPDHVDVKNHPLQNDIVIRMVDRKKVPLFITLSDVAVFFIKNSFSKKGSSATKMGEIMAMDIPVVTNTGWGDIAELQKKIPGLISITGHDEYDQAISKMQKPYSFIRESVQNEFALPVGIERYRSIYARWKNS